MKFKMLIQTMDNKQVSVKLDNLIDLANWITTSNTLMNIKSMHIIRVDK